MVLFGAPFLGLGGYFALAGLGAIAMAPGANAPDEVIGLVGLRGGLHAVDQASGESREMLSGDTVYAIAADGDRIWVGIRGSGSLEGDGELWRGLSSGEGLADADTTGIVGDGHGRLWLTFYGAGAAHADADALRGLLVPR